MKYLKFGIGIGLLSIVAVFALKAVQTTDAVITVEAINSQDITEKGWTTPPYSTSNGLSNVGQGELVYLSGREAGGDSVTAYAWAITSQPAASVVTLDSIDTPWTTFRPDTTGQFEIQLTITTTSGAADTSVTINSAHYIGAGGFGGLPAAVFPQCGLGCHFDNHNGWMDTKHSTKFTRDIDGALSSMPDRCLQCHTTGYDTTAVNGGFDDIAKAQGWTTPDTLQPGNWDDMVTNFPDVAAKANIQCESCHGPGSEHQGNPAKIDFSVDAGMCGKCHGSKSRQFRVSSHNFDQYGRGTRSSCGACHSASGFIARIDGSIEHNPNEPGNVSCAACHDPHSKANEHQIRTLDDVELTNGEMVTVGGYGKLCMQCHHSRRDAVDYVNNWSGYFGPHGNPQADMLMGKNAITFGLHIPSSNHRFYVENTCVTCHMAETPPRGEPGRDQIGSHTWTMHWDGGTPDDDSDDVYNVAACQECHGPITSFADIKAKSDYDRDGSIESTQEEISGVMDEVGMLLPPLGDPNVDVRGLRDVYDPNLPDLTPEEVAQAKLYLKAAYNYLFVESDGSHGVHNFQFALNLLKVAQKALTTGSLGAGMIAAITDVPNDQGKQVRVEWGRFSGDGVGPVNRYGLWRRVDDGAANASQQNLAVHESFDMKSEDVKAFSLGTRMQVADALWDFAGSVPAAGLEHYSAIAPTLFDSTASDGVHWSVFVVSGHTAVPAAQAISAPDSGYSVDNLTPAAPANIVGVETASGIDLTWDDPVDEDFNYFAVYRSTVQGFDPSTVDPINELTDAAYIDMDVNVGSTYYYRISAFDFAGNESNFSSEFSLMVTSVEGSITSAIPDDYMLEQNYPNPFNPSTTINFGLKESGHVIMTVYNGLGKEVMQLVDSQMEAGHHEVVLRGDNLASGLYFYKIQVNGFASVKKMIFMK